MGVVRHIGCGGFNPNWILRRTSRTANERTTHGAISLSRGSIFMSSTSAMGFPTTSEFLKFLCDCFGMPAPEIGGKYETLARFRNGTKLGRQKRVEVSRSLGNKLAKHFCPQFSEPELVGRILGLRLLLPEKVLLWPIGEDCKPVDLAGYLMLDMIEFVERYDQLAFHVRADDIPRKIALWHLATHFIIPFLAVKLAIYKRHGLFNGMPFGTPWYLPKWRIQGPTTWPVNHVFAWWEDLMGKRLTDVAESFTNTSNEEQTETRRMELYSWGTSEIPPSRTSIDLLTNATTRLPYGGIWTAPKNRPVQEMFEECKTFLLRKHSQRKASEQKRAKTVEVRNQTEGQDFPADINEIGVGSLWVFRDSGSSRLIFGVSSGRSVTDSERLDLLRRVSNRYARPTEQELRSRLITAIGFQNASRWAREFFGNDWFGVPHAWRLVSRFWAIESSASMYPALLSRTAETTAKLIEFQPDLKQINENIEWLFSARGSVDLHKKLQAAIRTDPFGESSQNMDEIAPVPPTNNGFGELGVIRPIRAGPFDWPGSD